MSESTESLLDQEWTEDAELIQKQLSQHAIEPIDEAAGVVFGTGGHLTALGRKYQFTVHNRSRLMDQRRMTLSRKPKCVFVRAAWEKANIPVFL